MEARGASVTGTENGRFFLSKVENFDVKWSTFQIARGVTTRHSGALGCIDIHIRVQTLIKDCNLYIQTRYTTHTYLYIHIHNRVEQ